MPRTVLLIDGNSLVYRAFFALPTDLATASGQVTNAVFGFTSMLVNLLRDHRPDALAVAFDRPEPTFRHERVDTYKANRSSAPDILRQQMGLVREVVDALRIPVFEVVGFEADDVIATLATEGRDRGDDVIIVTGDRDSYQLVEDPHVKVLYNKRGVSDYALYDEAGIAERTGVTPALYPQYAALRGDPSDNLPGVPGVGEKTAAKLITTYGGIDGIYENLDAQTPKLRENLAAHEANVRQNVEVMVLVRDVELATRIDDLAYDPSTIDIPEVRRLFEFLEFNTLFDRLGGGARHRPRSVDGGHRGARGRGGGGRIARPRGRGARGPGADGAARRPGPRVGGGGGPVRPRRAGRRPRRQQRRRAVDPGPAPRRRDGAGRRRGHGRARRPAARRPPGQADGASAHGARHRRAHALPRHRSGRLPARPGRVAVPARGAGGPLRRRPDPRGRPGRRRAARPRRSVHAGVAHRRPPGPRGRSAHRAAARRAQRAGPPRAQRRDRGAARRGAGPDGGPRGRRGRGRAQRHCRDRLVADCERLSAAIVEAAGHDFNVNSTLQLRQVLFDELGLTPQKKTKTGFSTDAASLEKLAGQHPIIDHLLRLPRGGEAPLHLRRRPPQRGGRRRPHPRHLQPDGRPHRSPVVGPAEPPQHPGALRARA